jgi:hypothetical protein
VSFARSWAASFLFVWIKAIARTKDEKRDWYSRYRLMIANFELIDFGRLAAGRRFILTLLPISRP